MTQHMHEDEIVEVDLVEVEFGSDIENALNFKLHRTS